MGHPVQGSWRNEYDSAYLPPFNDVVSSKREETCVKSVEQVKILGIAYGYDSSYMKGRIRNLEGTGHRLDKKEKVVLEELIRSLYLWTWLIDKYGLTFMIALDMAISVEFWPKTVFLPMMESLLETMVWCVPYLIQGGP